jgi:hypothetical protein
MNFSRFPSLLIGPEISLKIAVVRGIQQRFGLVFLAVGMAQDAFRFLQGKESGWMMGKDLHVSTKRKVRGEDCITHL